MTTWGWRSQSAATRHDATAPLVSPTAIPWYNKDGFYDLRVVGIDGVNPRVVYSDREHLADAICDRLLHHAHRIALAGPSMRGPRDLDAPAETTR